MSWENELRTEVVFRSPSYVAATTTGIISTIKSKVLGVGGEYRALWRNNERSFERKLGQFDPPKFQGTIVQDLGVKSMLYPLTVYFDGIFHHRDADAFVKALYSEPGQWEVIHPVRGPLILQLVSCREVMDPTENGNYTEIETQWIEPANVERLISPAELIADTLSTILALAEDASTVLTQLRSDIYSAIQAAINTFNKIAGSLDSLTGGLSSTSAIARDSYDSARATFNSAISDFGVDNPDSVDVAAGLVNMALAPIQASTDFSDRQSAYENLVDAIFALTPATTTRDDYNKVVAQEFGITLALMATAQIVVSSEYGSRADVVAAMDNVTEFFNSVIERIEAIQAQFNALDIDMQYYSQLATYTTLVNLYTLVFQYLLSQFYNLRAEKRFTLKRARSPIEITVAEYGSLGDADANYDLFVRSNNLSGNDILLVPAGREVVIYA